MSLLDDPALGLQAYSKGPLERKLRVPLRVRFQPGSTYARDFAIPDGAEGEVVDSHKRDGAEVLTLQIDGVGVATGVPAREVVEHGPDAPHAR